MTDQAKPTALSDVVRPGIDYPQKVKIEDIVGKGVTITAVEKVAGSKEFAIIEPETGEIVVRDYWNIEILHDGLVKTFSTGAMPIDKVLTSLQAKLDTGEVTLPLSAAFYKEGRTYIVQ